MRVKIEKKFALKLYCQARQAERSIDFAIGSSSQWELLCAYYTENMKKELLESIKKLKAALPSNQAVLPRDYFGRLGLADLVHFPIAFVVNRFKLQWQFTGDELHFVAASVESLLSLLSGESAPPAERLIELRMNLFICEHIISKRLVGLPELKAASNIEHFSQPDHTRHFSLEELGV